jgi:hypothetical protein
MLFLTRHAAPPPQMQILAARRSAAQRQGMLVDLTVEAPEAELAAAQAELCLTYVSRLDMLPPAPPPLNADHGGPSLCSTASRHAG